MLQKLVLKALLSALIKSLKGGSKWLAVTVLVIVFAVQALGLDYEGLSEIVAVANDVINQNG